MNDLIRINYDAEKPTVSARDLHEALGVKSKYADWFKNMSQYGFEENSDFVSFSKNLENGGRTIDHAITIPMAKELCMIQRTPKGKEFRQYFIAIEEKWNSPTAIMARALQFADKQIDNLKSTNQLLITENQVQRQQISELQPKASYYDVVLNCKDLLSTTKIAKDYGKSAIWLNNYLQKRGIQFKQGDIWLLYQKYADKGYTSTKTHTYNGDDGQQHSKVHTYWTQKGRLFIYSILKNDDILPQIEKDNCDN